jgi:sn-glycerol 3-phosphate transport system substrate-binding protein
MKRLTRRAALFAGGATVGTGACAAPAPASERRAGPPSLARGPVTLSYWKSLSGPRHEAQLRLVDTFHAVQPGIRVAVEHAGEYSALAEKLRVALAAGSPPDVAMLATNTDMPFFARIGALHALDEHAAGAGVPDAYFPGFMRDSRVGGRLFQLPFARSVPLLYLNRDLLQRAGEPVAGPRTWGDLRDACARVAAALRGAAPVRTGHTGNDGRGEAGPPAPAAPSVSGAAIGLGTSWLDAQSLLWSFGGAYSDDRLRPLAAAPSSVEAVQYLADLVHRHRAAAATRRAQAEFLAGGRAFFLGTSAQVGEMREVPFSAQAVPLPSQGAHGARALPAGGAGLSVLRPLPRTHQEAAWTFLRFLTDAPQTAAFASATGYLPVQPAALARPDLAASLRSSPAAALALDELQHVRPADAILATPFANAKIERALGRVLFDGVPPRAACEALDRDLARVSEPPTL